MLLENMITPSVYQLCQEAESSSDKFNTEIEIKELLMITEIEEPIIILNLREGEEEIVK